MTKARVDWMESGRVNAGYSSQFVQRVMKKTITSTGHISVNDGTVSGQHVTEYTITKPGRSYQISYWRPTSTTQLCIAFLDANDVLISSVKGKSPNGQRNETFTPPSGTAIIRVYGIYRSGNYVYSSITPSEPEGVFDVEEMRVKNWGDQQSQIVWPLFENWIISSATLDVTDSIRYDGDWVMRPSSTSYCYATGTVQHRRGTTVIEELQNVPLTAVSMDYNSSVVVDGETKQVFTITTKNGRSVVTGVDMKTTPDSGGFSTNVTFTYQGLASTVLTVKQAPNTASAAGYVNQQDLSYRIELSPLTLGQSGGEVTVYGYLTKTKTQRYQWTSWAYSYGAPEVYDEAHLTSVSVSPTPTDIDGAVVTLPGNSGTSEIVYTFTGYYSSYQASNHATVYGSDSGHTYSNLSVSASYPDDISAGGGGVYPVVSVSIRQDNSYTLTGTASNGATSLTVSDGSHSTIVALSYSNGANGFISAESRGSVPGPRQEIASCRVDVSKAMRNGTLSASSNASAWQAANIETIVQGSFVLDALAVYLLVNGQVLPISSGAYQLDTARTTSVYVQVRATGHGTTTRYSYTSGVVVGGDTVNLDNEPVTPRSVSVTVGQTAITVDNQTFSASNIHVLQTRTYSIAAVYEGTTANASVVQAADEKIDGEAQVTVTLSEEANSNTLWAGGGEVILRGSAFQESGKFWKSDGARVEGETSPPVYILNQIALNPSDTTHFTIYPKDTYSTYKTFRVVHRDMENNVTTDTLSITANVGTVYTDPLSFSVSNQPEPANWFRENAGVVWNDYFPKERTYEIYFEISRYTSDSDRAPSRANGVISTTYSVLARHSMYYYRTGVENTNKYIPYTSWSQEHNDDNHRYLDSVDSLPVWEWGNFIEWVTDAPSISRPSSDSWLTINATSNTGGTLIFAQQTSGGERRGTTVTAMNPSDPSTNRQTISIGVFQNRYQNITVTPTTIPTFSWDRPGTATISVYAENVPFQISRSNVDNAWYNMYISIGGTTPVVVEEDTDYGSANTSQLFTIEIHPGINTGLQHFTTLWIKAQELQDVLQPIGVTLSQEAYDPGPSNND